MPSSVSRRAALKRLAGATVLSTLAPAALGAGARSAPGAPARALLGTGQIRQSVCKWCFPDLSVDALAEAAAGMGMVGIDLLGPDEWGPLKKHGLVCTMAWGPGSIPEGWNRPGHHEWLIPSARTKLQEISDAGFPNMIVFSGNRDGMDDEEGLEHCAAGLKQIMADAERLGVTVCMELLNSKVDHPDYMCDHTAWGAALVDRVGSDRFKLLYDIYHMQIMEGDVIRTIRTYADRIGHYHTAGNPGRHEIDETQELYYPAIMRAILDTGYEGFVAQEFIPTGEPLAALASAVRICDV